MLKNRAFPGVCFGHMVKALQAGLTTKHVVYLLSSSVCAPINLDSRNQMASRSRSSCFRLAYPQASLIKGIGFNDESFHQCLRGMISLIIVLRRHYSFESFKFNWFGRLILCRCSRY